MIPPKKIIVQKSSQLNLKTVANLAQMRRTKEELRKPVLVATKPMKSSIMNLIMKRLQMHVEMRKEQATVW